MDNNHKLTRKIQVLLTPEEQEQLNNLILQEALKNNKKPASASYYVRKIIQKEIQKKVLDEYNNEQSN